MLLMVKIKPVLIIGVFLFFVASLLLSSFALINPRVYAEATGEWVDAAHIKIGDDVYIDKTLFDSMDYFLNGNDNDCTSVIKHFNKNYGESDTNYASAELITKTRNATNGDCETSEENITLSQTAKSDILFRWVDIGKIEATFFGVGQGVYDRRDSSNEYINDIDGNCKSSLTVDNSNNEQGTFILRFDFSGDCVEGDPYVAEIHSVANSEKPAGTGNLSVVQPGDDLGTEALESCETLNTGALDWLVCGLFDWINTMVESLFNLVDGLLDINAQQIRDNDQLKSTWSYFRVVATFLLLAVGMVMVISQAIGGRS